MLLAPGVASAQTAPPDEGFGWYVRAGGVARYNVKASVVGVPPGTGNGIYDDGYVLKDIGGSPVKTWNWGYTGSTPGQVSGGQLTLSRVDGVPVMPRQDTSFNSLFGGELVGGAQIAEFEIGRRRARVCLEMGLGYSSDSKGMSFGASGNATRTADSFNLNGIVPPVAPYGGTAVGPGPLLDLVPAGSVVVASPVTTSFQGTLATTFVDLRLGPMFEIDLTRRLSVSLSGGYSAVFVDAQLRYVESVSFANPAIPSISPASYKTSNHRWHPGAFAEMNFNWRITNLMGAFAGGEIQGNSNAPFGDAGHQIKVNLGTTYAAKAGIIFHF
jgi:hypothetical protein